MHGFSRRAAVLALLLGIGGGAYAATVHGDLSYDGAPLADTFPQLIDGAVFVYDFDTNHAVSGTVDAARGTYTVTDVAPGENLAVTVTVRHAAGGTGHIHTLRGIQLLSVSDAGADITLPVSLGEEVHFVAPYDSTDRQDGSIFTCLVGTSYAPPVRVRWEPVPHAITYTATVDHEGCNFTVLTQDILQTNDTGIDVAGPSPGEDHVAVNVECSGSDGRPLYAMPFVPFNDGAIQTYPFRVEGQNHRGTHPSGAIFLPAVASVPGVPPTYWSSSVWLLNPGETEVPVQLFFTPRGENGLETHDVQTVNVPAHAAVSWPDVLHDLFGRSGAGSLEVRGAGMIVKSRTSTPATGGGGGSYGQGMPAVATNRALSLAGTPRALAPGVGENAGFRTNLGLCEVWGEPATVVVSIYDQSMSLLGTTTVELEPYMMIQLNRVARAAGVTGAVTNGVVGLEVTAGSGRVVAYLSVIDNGTGDPTTILPEPIVAP